MKIVVSATGETLESQIDPRFGRCQYFLLVEAEGSEVKTVKAVPNEGAAQGHGAGIRAAQQVGNLGAEKIITGNLGPNAFNALTQLGLESYRATGVAKDAVDKLLKGELPKIATTVPDHFGMGGRGGGGGGGRGGFGRGAGRGAGLGGRW